MTKCVFFLLWLIKFLDFSCFHFTVSHTRDPHSTSNLFYKMSYINLPSLQVLHAPSSSKVVLHESPTLKSADKKKARKKRKKGSFRSSFSSVLVWILKSQVICSSLHGSSFSSEANSDLIIYFLDPSDPVFYVKLSSPYREFMFYILLIFCAGVSFEILAGNNMNMDKTPIAGDGGGDAGGGGGGSGNGPEMQSSLDAVAPSPTPHTELDISSMPDTPLRKPGHRRALSEIIGLPDDLDLGGPGAGDAPALSDENEEELFSMFLDVDKLNSRCGASESEPSCAMAGGPGEATETPAAASGAAQGQMHHHNRHSMDASSSIDAEHLFGTTVTEGVSPAEAKKAMSAANLAELALIDPKKAKRYHFCGSLL
jgi:hypothetical protein